METVQQAILTENKTAPFLSAGDRVGRWTVLDSCIRTPKGEKKLLCRCDCGTERYVLERSLRFGYSTSCGCLRKERVAEATTKDLTGMKYGELTVIKRLSSNAHRSSRWLCKCSCGAEYITLGSLLLTGRRTHCSARHHRNYYYVDITGQKFRRLTALYPVAVESGVNNTRRRCLIWHCRCDCGNELDVSYNELCFSPRQSCGCQKKEHDKKLHEQLIHVDGTSIDMIRSKKVPTNNTTGCRGVYCSRGKYKAKIVFQKKQYYLGTYSKIEDAIEARREAEKILFDDVVAFYQKWKEKANAEPAWAEQNPIQIDVKQENQHIEVNLLPVLD